MSQGSYISAQMANHSRSALPPLAINPSGFSQVINAERMAGSRSAALSNLSNLATQTREVVSSQFAMLNNNMIPLPPLPAPWANDLIPIQQTSRALMLSDYSQLQFDSMAGINQAAMYNFSDRFSPSTHDMVSYPFVSGSNNNIPLQFPWAYNDIPLQFPWSSTANIPIAVQQTSRVYPLIAAQQASRANNNTPLQLRGASWSYDLFSVEQWSRAVILSDRSQVSNVERLGQTNPAMVYSFSSYSACQSSEIVTTRFTSSNIIPSQAPGPWVDLIRAPPPAPRLRDFLTETTRNNVDSLLYSSLNQLPSSILPVLDRSGLVRSTDDLLSDIYYCSKCSAMFPSHQAFGGHMSSHSKEKRKQDQLNVMPSTSRGSAKNVGGSAADEDYWFDIGESSSKKKVKRESS